MVSDYVAVIARQVDARRVAVPGMQVNLSNLSTVVYSSGSKLLEALSGELGSQLPHLIVIDLTQLEPDELDFVRNLKADSRLQRIPVLMQKVQVAA